MSKDLILNRGVVSTYAASFESFDQCNNTFNS